MNFLKRLFPKQQRIHQPADPEQASDELRSMILHLKPEALGIKVSENTPNVWGVLMEYWINQTVVTVVSLADGTTSMYFSSGGGFIGAGEHPKPAMASQQLIQAAESFLAVIPESIACPMPINGNVRFHLLTFDGSRSIEVAENEVEKPSHPFFSLYARGQRVITEIRIHTDANVK